MRRVKSILALAVLLLPIGTGRALAEPRFLSKQYTRCTSCHYSPTGGGLLTPYGRSLSQELSTTGAPAANVPSTVEQPSKEASFLWGVLGDKLGPVDLGADLRPSHLGYESQGVTTNNNLFMTADLLGAFRSNGWTLYGELGRLIRPEGGQLDSYEYWAEHQNDKGLGFRVGRFLPAFGIRFADHSDFNRSRLGFDKYDQVYALEVSRSAERYLWQVSVGPGWADSVLEDDGRQAFTATGRFQFDLSNRQVLVLSGLYRNASREEARTGAADVAFGIAPTPRISIWTEATTAFREETSGSPSMTLVNETAVEVYRGIWLSFSPQINTPYGDASAGTTRLAFGAQFLPRTHWDVGLSYYRDRNRESGFVSKIFLAQLHLFL